LSIFITHQHYPAFSSQIITQLHLSSQIIPQHLIVDKTSSLDEQHIIVITVDACHDIHHHTPSHVTAHNNFSLIIINRHHLLSLIITHQHYPALSSQIITQHHLPFVTHHDLLVVLLTFTHHHSHPLIVITNHHEKKLVIEWQDYRRPASQAYLTCKQCAIHYVLPTSHTEHF